MDQHLLAVVADHIAVGNWQRQGKSSAKRPEPISPLAKRAAPTRKGDVGDRSPDEAVVLLERYRTGFYDRG